MPTSYMKQLTHSKEFKKFPSYKNYKEAVWGKITNFKINYLSLLIGATLNVLPRGTLNTGLFELLADRGNLLLAFCKTTIHYIYWVIEK